MVATELLKLAMETDEERKARMKKMIATTQLRLAPETEDEIRAGLEYLSDNPIYIPNNLYENILTLGKLLSLWFCFLLHSILFLISQTSYRTYKIISSYELARPIMGTIFLVIVRANFVLITRKEGGA